jgi:hypothetical protein
MLPPSSRVAAQATGGGPWTSHDEVVIENEAEINVMSVSLNRLQGGRIGLLYLRKNSLTDCRPVIRFSDDEAGSWSKPIPVIGEKEREITSSITIAWCSSPTDA